MTTKQFLPVILTLASPFLVAEEEDNTYTTRTAVMAITEKNVHKTVGGKNPAHIKSDGPFVTADFLYWKAGIDGLEIATRSSINETFTSFNTKEMDFSAEWRPGFRLGFGWLFGEYDQWDLYTNWTFFYDKAKIEKGTKNSFITNYIPSWSPILGPTSPRISGNWNLNYNTLDLEIGRNYFISSKIALRPHVGLRGVWIDIDYKAKYVGTWAVATLPTGVVQYAASKTMFKASNDFEGIGVRSGADLLWHFSDHFGIGSKISAALLYGHFDVDETFYAGKLNISQVPETLPFITPYKQKYSKNLDRVRANIEAFLGLFFETGLSNGKYHFTLQAGYELSEWFEQNQLVAFAVSRDSRLLRATPSLPSNLTFGINNDVTEIARDGNLGLQGLTISACFNF
ncbi:MAG: Lpg1974 family pore-forming outer membrane protein [Chlamydiota bacterium]